MNTNKTNLNTILQRTLAAVALGVILCMACPTAAFAGPRGKIWQKDIPYGEHPKQKLDIYKPEGKGPFPFILYIHGGGWYGGDKEWGDQRALDAGVAWVSINYRFIHEATQAGIFPPIMGPFDDAKRALQFIRNHAKEYDLDPTRVGLTGGSAGACTSLWLGCSSDMADPKSADPIARESTRVTVIAVTGAQTSLDPTQMREWVGPNLQHVSQVVGLPDGQFQKFYDRRAEFEKYYPIMSPAAQLSAGDPPIHIFYVRGPDDPKKDPSYYCHSPDFGLGFQKLAKEKGVECHVAWKGHEDGFTGDTLDFLIQHLTPKTK